MARPRKLGMDYFPHDSDASNDEKIEGLRALYGNDGYAFYFILLERIYRSEKFELDISNIDIKTILARKIEVKVPYFEKMLNSALNLNCFDKEAFNKRKVLTSNGIKKRSEIVVDKRLKMQNKYKETSTENAKETTKDNLSITEAETTLETDIKLPINTSETKEEITPKTIIEITQETTKKTPSETIQSKVKQSKVKHNSYLLHPQEDMEGEDDDYKFKTNIVVEYFRNKSRNKTCDELDFKCANELVKYIDTDTINIGVETAFNRFSPKYKDDNIKTFRYCKSVILEMFNLKKRGGASNGGSCKFQDAINDKQDAIAEIVEKYGIIQSEGAVQDFKCQL